MTAPKRLDTWVPSLTVTRSGLWIKLTNPGASSVEYEISPRDLVRFYYELRQALSGSAEKSRNSVKPKS